MKLCTEREYRASLSDAEFWEHVFGGGLEVEDDYDAESDPNFPFDTPLARGEWGACPVCGEHGPCGYDFQGEPMRHVVQSGVEQ